MKLRRKLNPKLLTVRCGGLTYGPISNASRQVLSDYVARGGTHVYIDDDDGRPDSNCYTATLWYGENKYEWLAHVYGPEFAE
jgi:hypothetical protein